MTNYEPGDRIRIIHKDSGVQFPVLVVSDDGWSNSVVYSMNETWIVDSDEIFEAMYPGFELELMSRGINDESIAKDDSRLPPVRSRTRRE